MLKEEDAQEEEEFKRECQALTQYVQERLDRLGTIGMPCVYELVTYSLCAM